MTETCCVEPVKLFSFSFGSNHLPIQVVALVVSGMGRRAVVSLRLQLRSLLRHMTDRAEGSFEVPANLRSSQLAIEHGSFC